MPVVELLAFWRLKKGVDNNLFGTVWLAYQAHMGFAAALGAGVIPFIPGDLAKIIIVLIAGPIIRKQLKRAGLN